MPATTDRKLRVFLCHSSQDKPIVRELYQRLNAEGWIDPWLDEEKLLPGQDWDMEIEKAVEATDAVIVCLSNNSITKEGVVQKEIRRALDKAEEKPEDVIFVIPLRLEDCQVPRRLKSYQYQDYFSSVELAYARLCASLEERAITLSIDILELKETFRRQQEEKYKQGLEERIQREAEEKIRVEREEQLRIQYEKIARDKNGDLVALQHLGLFSSNITFKRIISVVLIVGVPMVFIALKLIDILSSLFPNIIINDWSAAVVLLFTNLLAVIFESYRVILNGKYFIKYSRRRLGALIGLLQGLINYSGITMYIIMGMVSAETTWSISNDLSYILLAPLIFGGPITVLTILVGFFMGYFLENKNLSNLRL